MQDLKQYLKEWRDTEGVKPVNDPDFIAGFLQFAKASDFDQWEFSGDNHYCGFTAILYEHPVHLPVSGEVFEFAYGRDFVKVFTGFHHGFWVPEYISLKGDDAIELLRVLKSKLNRWAGLGWI